tara:strand:- start:2005 stop:3627 length:1623 start_codon:yes stop_codon:yes gene_type:complete
MAVDRPIFGASNSDTSLFTGGALSALETIAGGKNQAQQAMELTRALTPQRQEFDPALAAMKYFVGMTKAASQKGATLLGSAAQAVVEPAAYLEQINDYNRKLTASQGQTAVTLAGALKPAKTTGSTTYKSIIIKMKDGSEKQDYVLVGDIARIKALPNVVSVSEDKTSTASGGAKKPSPYSVPTANMAKLAETLGYQPPEDALGNVLLDPEQYLKVKALVAGPTAKTSQGSAYERLQANVNRIGLAINSDPENVSDADKLEYLQDYQKLVKGSQFKETTPEGREITRRIAGIDLSNSGLPIPEGFDPNEVLEETSREWGPSGTIANYGQRMLFTEGIVRNALATGYVPNFQDVVADNFSSWFGTTMLTEEGQQFYAASRNFAAAALRKESGAAISDGEYLGYMQQYFPQVGDSEQTISNKQSLRATVIQGMIAESGDAFGSIYADASQYLTIQDPTRRNEDGTPFIHDIINPQKYANAQNAKSQLGQNLLFNQTMEHLTWQNIESLMRADAARPEGQSKYTVEQFRFMQEQVRLKKQESN